MYHSDRCVILLLFQESAYDGTLCSLKNYTTCFNEKKISGEKEAHSGDLVRCEEKCLDLCERTTYIHPEVSEYIYSAEGSVYKQKRYSIIQLVVANFEYPIFEETFKYCPLAGYYWAELYPIKLAHQCIGRKASALLPPLRGQCRNYCISPILPSWQAHF